jgi:hypothetical protein
VAALNWQTHSDIIPQIHPMRTFFSLGIAGTGVQNLLFWIRCWKTQNCLQLPKVSKLDFQKLFGVNFPTHLMPIGSQEYI